MYYLIFLPPLVLLFLSAGASGSTWAPFQSDQVKEICAHMTAEERRRTVGRGGVFGAILGGALGVTGFFAMLISRAFVGSALIGMVIVLFVGMPLIGILLWKFKPLIDKSQKEFLASTTWAKEHGLTSENIVLRSFK